ncbi:MAG: hypothetical protein WEB03_01665 [Nitriliruptor sp.]|uniref:hypothetical protein n=1 Tax=Nitriliruptor sp. TaxID=2448056 RepID=UPI0034A06101
MARGTSDAGDLHGLRREFAALPLSSRRAVARAVSRGRAVDERKLAVHAVLVARRQQRLWRWVWLAGPAIGITQISAGWQAAVVAIAISTVTMGLLSRYWLLKARRAEADNLGLVSKRQRARLDPPGDGPPVSSRGA